MAEHEIWKTVPGFTDYYEVSNLGRVRSVDRVVRVVKRWGITATHPQRRRGKMLSPTPDENGYLRVKLSFQGTYMTRRVHHLVLEAFVGDCPPGMEACHNDRNPANNHVSNLRWDTPKGNQADALKHGTRVRGERKASAKLTRQDVQMIRVSDLPNRAIAKAYGISPGHVSQIRNYLKWGWYDAKSS